MDEKIEREVTTCVVVWIEITHQSLMAGGILVTTCVVVWIEILLLGVSQRQLLCHHLRGGVD